LSQDEEVLVEEVVVADPELVAALRALIPQLSSSATPLTAYELEDIVDSRSTVLFVARIAGRIVGSLTLALFRIPTGMRAWIEDVVVDGEIRGQGVGAALVTEALERAAGAGARTVDLTSRASRQEANRLYVRLGFSQRETNVYRWTATTQGPN
jgi:ribosomal protein S18 acetylase RimI-like enzyme